MQEGSMGSSKMLQKLRSEVEQFGILGDIHKSRFSWALVVTAGRGGWEGEKAG